MKIIILSSGTQVFPSSTAYIRWLLEYLTESTVHSAQCISLGAESTHGGWVLPSHKPLLNYGNIGRFEVSAAMSLALRRQIRETDSAAVVAFGTNAMYLGLAATAGLPVKNLAVLGHEHNSPPTFPKQVQNMLQGRIGALVYMTRTAAWRYPELQDKQHFGLNGLWIGEQPQTRSGPHKYTSPMLPYRIVCNPGKPATAGVSLALQILELLPDRATLELVVEDSETEQVKQQVLVQELTHRVSLVRSPEFEGRSLVLSTAGHDIDGSIILGACLNGIPAIAKDCDFAPRDIIENEKTGFLINNSQPEAYSSRIRLLMASSELSDTLAIAAFEHGGNLVSRTAMEDSWAPIVRWLEQ